MANLGKSYANTDLMEEVGGGKKEKQGTGGEQGITESSWMWLAAAIGDSYSSCERLPMVCMQTCAWHTSAKKF